MKSFVLSLSEIIKEQYSCIYVILNCLWLARSDLLIATINSWPILALLPAVTDVLLSVLLFYFVSKTVIIMYIKILLYYTIIYFKKHNALYIIPNVNY